MSQKEDDFVNIVLIDQDHSNLSIRVKPFIKMSKIKTYYCKKRGVSMESLRFYFDGERINDGKLTKIYN